MGIYLVDPAVWATTYAGNGHEDLVGEKHENEGFPKLGVPFWGSQ